MYEFILCTHPFPPFLRLLHVRSHVCSHVWGTHMCEGVCGGERLVSSVLSCSPPYTLSKNLSLEPRAYRVSWFSCPACDGITGSLTGAGDQNSSTYSCMASALPTEQSPRSILCFCKTFIIRKSNLEKVFSFKPRYLFIKRFRNPTTFYLFWRWDLAMWSGLMLNSASSCYSLPSADIIGLYHCPAYARLGCINLSLRAIELQLSMSLLPVISTELKFLCHSQSRLA